ncbi:MAG: fibronectin type III domain-containing protein [Candidatus Eisenbacteria bacterium]
MRKTLLCFVMFVPAVLAGCSGGGDGGSGPDPKPPVIASGPAASGITEGSATITWRTDKSSDSEVVYGQTTSYGDTAFTGAMTLNHSIALTGLNHSATYHYRVSSEDDDGLSVT